MKLLFVLPNFNGGGAERVTIQLANGLASRGHEVHLVTLNSRGPLKDHLSSCVQLHDLNAGRLRQGIFRLISRLKHTKPDVVFSTFAYISVVIILARSILPKNTRLWIREANLPSLSLEGSRKLRFLRKATRLSYRRADLVVASSQRMMREFTSDFSIPGQKLQILPNPVDVEAIRSALVSPRSAMQSGRRFVASGRLTWQKGFDRLLQAFSDPGFAKDHLVILGQGELESDLKQLSRDLGCEERVQFAGFVKEPWQIYSDCDAFLLPSRWEGMPNAALEALACGAPVIATPEAGGIEEVNGKDRNSAVVIVGFPVDFISEMQKVAVHKDEKPRPSLVPDDYLFANVIKQFESWL